MFQGRSYHNLDEKGRISVPARFREALQAAGQSELMVTNLFDYLPAFPLPLWQRIAERLNKNVSIVDRRHLKFVRFFIGGAELCPIDKQGRILLPPSLRSYAALDKEVVMVGMGDRFEIWSKARYDGEMGEVESGIYDEESLRVLGNCLVGE